MQKQGLNYIATFFRSCMLAKYVCLTVYSFNYLFPILELTPDFANKNVIMWAYLTFWNSVIQHVYVCLVLFEDFLIIKKSSMEKIEKIKSFNASFFSSLVIPFSCLTTILFWSFYLINPYLLAPYSVIGKVPLLWQIATHLVILVPVVTETLFANRSISEYKSSLLYFNVAFGIYMFANLMAYVGFGQWTYKFMEDIGWTERIIVAHLLYILGLTSFHLGMKVQHEVRAIIDKKVD